MIRVSTDARASWMNGVNPRVALASIVGLLVIIVLVIRRRKFVALYSHLPGNKAYPIIGNLHELLISPSELYIKAHKDCHKFGGYYLEWIGMEPYVLLGSAESVQPILSTTNSCLDKSEDYNLLLGKWLRTGLLTSKREKWQHRRKLLTPSLHIKLLESYIQPMSHHCDILVNQLKKEEGKGDFDITKYISLAALDMIAVTAMGYELHAQTNSRSEYAKAVEVISTIVQTRATSPLLKIEFLYKFTKYAKAEEEACKVVHGLRNTIVAERRASKEQSTVMSEDGKVRLSLLDFMLEKNMSDEDIGEEVDTFIYGGQDTVTTVLSWGLFILAHNKDMQVKILQEYEKLVASTENPYSVSSLNKLEYLERCIKEIMRLYAPVPFIGRAVDKAIELNGRMLPAGTKIIIVSHAIHKDPKHYPEPDRFDPDRFLPENASRRHPHAFIPFSAGIRNCIGQKYAMLVLKIVLIKILQSYEISTTVKPSELKLYPQMVLHNEGGIHISIQKRNEATI